MRDEEPKTLRWRELRQDGSYGDPVVLTMPAHDHAFLTGLWREVERHPEGSYRRMLVKELEVHLALHAFFPGGHYVEEPTPVTPIPPAYVRRQLLEEQKKEAGDDQGSLFV